MSKLIIKYLRRSVRETIDRFRQVRRASWQSGGREAEYICTARVEGAARAEGLLSHCRVNLMPE